MRRIFHARLGALLAILVVGLAGCGGASPKISREPRAVWCPNAGLARGIQSRRRVSGSFDARDLLGKPLGDARRVAARHDCEVRVANRTSALTAEWDLGRVDVRIQDGIVVQVKAS